MLITLGGIIVWALIDVFFIGKRIEEKNQILESEILQQILLLDQTKSISQVAATTE